MSFNDSVDNAVPFDAVQLVWDGTYLVFAPYTIPTELPYNHRGLTCAEGGSPTGSDLPITDPHPMASPVADAWRAGAVEDPDARACW